MYPFVETYLPSIHSLVSQSENYCLYQYGPHSELTTHHIAVCVLLERYVVRLASFTGTASPNLMSLGTIQ